MLVLFTVVMSIVFTEFVGYWLHILLHSEKLPWLSRNHMIHHLKDYGPHKKMHRDHYVNSGEGRANILGTGLEWMIPVVLITATTLFTLSLFGVSLVYQAIFTGTAMVWGHFLFGTMHSAMHLNNFWMTKVPGLRGWYREVRKLHDFHHLQISEDGRMLTNYGICFFWFDRLFGSYSPKAKSFNHEGYEAALYRYSSLLNKR